MEDAPTLVADLFERVRGDFGRAEQILSFEEWFGRAAANPRRHLRNAAQYLADALDFYGVEEVERPGGTVRRWKLFDCPWDDGKDHLVGQETVQEAIARVVHDFARAGRVNRLIMLHGPNGSAKSTAIACLMRAIEDYSRRDEGVLYTFNWVFPSSRVAKKPVGFGAGSGSPADSTASYAYLPDDDIDARIPADLRDHPALLIPRPYRREVLEALFERAGVDPAEFLLSETLAEGDLSPRSRQIFDALLAAYQGDYARVLQHVQVERFYVSRRYRRAAVTVEPQLHVDAAVRMITADQSYANLPGSLRNLTMFEPYGDLVDASRGIVEYNDLLEKPVESYKYLLATSEKSSVALPNAILFPDVVMFATTNEHHLQALKKHAYFLSFRGRLHLVRVPYLLDYLQEQAVYDAQVTPRSTGKPIAPHATLIAALFAVLTRMRRPNPERYPAKIRGIIGKLGPLEKADLYATGRAPAGLPLHKARDLRAALRSILEETAAEEDYEGSFGASPREMMMVLLAAAHRDGRAFLSPLSVIEELEELVKQKGTYAFLQIQPAGDYHNPQRFLELIVERYTEVVDGEVRQCMGLVGPQEYRNLFERYVTHITAVQRGERIHNPVTGEFEEPDEDFMREMERRFGIERDRTAFRRDLVSRIGAFAIDHPGEPLDYEELFPQLFEAMAASWFKEQTQTLKRRASEILHYIAGDLSSLTPRQRERTQRLLECLKERCGYDDASVREMLVWLLRRRYV